MDAEHNDERNERILMLPDALTATQGMNADDSSPLQVCTDTQIGTEFALQQS